jgi:signal transduction histidine kinase
MSESGLSGVLFSRLKWLVTPTSPLRILGTIAIAIFAGETLVMFILALLPPLPVSPEAFIDSTLLIVITSPALYLFLFQPIIRHVRQREEAEKSVRKSNDLLQTVFDGISDPLILLDKDLKVRMINKAASQYYQIGSHLVDDQPCHRIFMSGEQPCPECDIPQRIAEGTNHLFERKGLFDPSRIEQVVIYRSDDQSGHIGAAIIKIIDVTETRALERQMRQRERLASLGLLISGVAHEINNPNTFISFNLPILKAYLHEIVPVVDAYASDHDGFEVANMPYAQFREDLFKLIENITHGSQRINDIVSRLKEFSRIREGQTLSEVSIPSRLDKVVMLANSQVKRMVNQFEMEVASDLPLFYTDGQAVEQVVLNLLINACHAVDKSDSWVRLKAYPVAGEPRTLCVEVADNGCGMDDYTMQHIFDPLFTTKGPDTGTGLGLYVCHNLVDGLGGVIEVESELGVGSTFKVTLPDLRSRVS